MKTFSSFSLSPTLPPLAFLRATLCALYSIAIGWVGEREKRSISLKLTTIHSMLCLCSCSILTLNVSFTIYVIDSLSLKKKYIYLSTTQPSSSRWLLYNLFTLCCMLSCDSMHHFSNSSTCVASHTIQQVFFFDNIHCTLFAH